MRSIFVIFFSAFVGLAMPPSAIAQDEDVDCMDCHDDASLEKVRDGLTISLLIDYSLYRTSVHADEGCISCHEDVDPEDLPHEDDLARVDCSMCHDVDDFESSDHGLSLQRGGFLAPTCSTCHNKHNIRSPGDPESWVHSSNISRLCSSCHKQSLEISSLRPLNSRERVALEPLQDVLHGDGGLGLTLTPVCSTCHAGHDAQSAEAPDSPTHRSNIVQTCLECHGQIEEVHAQVFEGDNWSESLLNGPICIDCHGPHKLSTSVTGLSDATCLTCHGDETLAREKGGQVQSLHIDSAMAGDSVHGELTCVSCHANVGLDHDPVCLDSGPVNCTTCHTEAATDFAQSEHGTLRAEGSEIAPGCLDCHGTHDIRSPTDLLSATFPRNIPDLCGTCHREGEQAAVANNGDQKEIIDNYVMSIHGRGLIDSGLIVTATCVDCHTAHRELPSADSSSTVHANNIAGTCATCHTGIYETLKSSVHSPLVTQTDEKLPTCNDCHSAHQVQRVSEDAFRQDILDQCGSCHEDLTDRYFETFHGKVSYLGETATARCYDCHGSHNILPKKNPESTLSEENVVATCAACHPKANRRFAEYLTHADYHDGEKYPRLNFAFLAMTILLVSVFFFFGIHTLLWFPRALSERKKYGRSHDK